MKGLCLESSRHSKEQVMSNSLEKALSDTFLDQIQINRSILETALRYDGEQITNLTDKSLSATLYDLSRYQIYLQLHANIRLTTLISAKRAYQNELRRTVIRMSEMKEKMTVKEKEARAIEDNPILRQLEEEFEEAEKQEALFRRVPEQTIELVNALKKELSRRGGP